MKIDKSIKCGEKTYKFSKIEISETNIKFQLAYIEVTAWYMNDDGRSGTGVHLAKFQYEDDDRFSDSYVTKDVTETYARQFVTNVLDVPFELIETTTKSLEQADTCYEVQNKELHDEAMRMQGAHK